MNQYKIVAIGTRKNRTSKFKNWLSRHTGVRREKEKKRHDARINHCKENTTQQRTVSLPINRDTGPSRYFWGCTGCKRNPFKRTF